MKSIKKSLNYLSFSSYIDYNFCWLVGLSATGEVWTHNAAIVNNKIFAEILLR